jgi:hypothetical protein
MTYNLPVQAIGAPQVAYNYFQNYRGFAGNFDDGTCKSDCFYWILTRLYHPIGIEIQGNEVPGRYTLYQSYPNPFNPAALIKFDIPRTSAVKLIVFDLLGREVATLVNDELKAGKYKIDWNASSFASGVYLYKLTAGDFTETKKMILLK